MAVLVAIGLDGQPVPLDEVDRAERIEPVATADDIRIFDGLPKWAREVLREFPLYDVKARAIAPHIYSGVVNRFNIHEQLSANDARLRQHFREKDRADGLA